MDDLHPITGLVRSHDNDELFSEKNLLNDATIRTVWEYCQREPAADPYKLLAEVLFKQRNELFEELERVRRMMEEVVLNEGSWNNE